MTMQLYTIGIIFDLKWLPQQNGVVHIFEQPTKYGYQVKELKVSFFCQQVLKTCF